MSTHLGSRGYPLTSYPVVIQLSKNVAVPALTPHHARIGTGSAVVLPPVPVVVSLST